MDNSFADMAYRNAYQELKAVQPLLEAAKTTTEVMDLAKPILARNGWDAYISQSVIDGQKLWCSFLVIWQEDPDQSIRANVVDKSSDIQDASEAILVKNTKKALFRCFALL